MKLLLDTCVLLWMVGEPGRISPRARQELTRDDAELVVPAISAFEISIKYRKGKLSLPLPPRPWFREALSNYGVAEIPITSEIAGLAPEVDIPLDLPWLEEELTRRKNNLLQNPDSGLTWTEVKRRVRARHGR